MNYRRLNSQLQTSEQWKRVKLFKKFGIVWNPLPDIWVKLDVQLGTGMDELENDGNIHKLNEQTIINCRTQAFIIERKVYKQNACGRVFPHRCEKQDANVWNR